MRDGTNLSATVYRDPKQTKPLPVILTMTPYIAEHAARQGVFFAQNGYVFVAVDLRGRGNSEGTFHPGLVEAKDGFDTVEWLAKQPWCDGQVAMWGGSWLGFTQWAIAKEFPPHLKAIAPTASVHPGVDYPQPQGVFMAYMLQWLSYVHGRALNTGLFGAGDFWANARWQLVAEGRAFSELEELTGVRGTDFKTWLKHPTEDSYWKAMTPQQAHYAQFKIPVLSITGHFDGDQLGALTYYDRYMAWSSESAKEHHLLVIGPWNHGGTRRPKTELGGISFGKEASTNMEDLHKAWYDHVLKGSPRPEFLKDRVACFVMGQNRWLYASSLSAIEGRPLTFSLDLKGATVGEVMHGGTLLTGSPSETAQVILNSNPQSLPDRSEIEREEPNFLKDQRKEFKINDHSVIWTSSPMANEVVFSGRPKLRLSLSINKPDADLWAKLFEVLPDGNVVFLSDSQLRLRYRHPGNEALMTPGRTEMVDFPDFQFFARSLEKGSRLRLIVSSDQSLGLQRNSNAGGDLATTPLREAQPAKITLYSGPDHHSFLSLPQPDPAILLPVSASNKIP